MVEFYELKVAREACECYDCGGPIEAGAEYREIQGEYDGPPDELRNCGKCRCDTDFRYRRPRKPGDMMKGRNDLDEEVVWVSKDGESWQRQEPARTTPFESKLDSD